MNGCGTYRLCRCRVLEETVTAGMVSLMLGCGLWVLVILTYSPYSSEILFPAGVGLPPGFLLCVRVRRPRSFGFSMGERTSV